jgi:hypothetical protein
MATSGSKQIDIYSSWLWLKYSWWQTSQSIANNTTTIGWKLELTSGNGALYKSDRTWTVVNDGAKQTGKVKISLDKYSTQQIASGTSVIKHNNDGSKTFSYSFSQQFELTLNSGAYMGTYSGNGNDTLTTIKRASQPSLVTYPNSTQNVGEFGEEFSIHMNTASQDFRHVVRYEYGDRKGQIASNVVNGTTWAVPLDFMNDIPNATSGSGRIYADTYHNNVLIGTKYTGFTATVPSNIKPSCSIQVLDNTPHGAYYGKLVKGLSRIYVKTTFNPAYSSPVDRYQVTANGVNYSEAEIVTGLISKAGTNTVTAKVTDKRGRTSEAVSYSFDVLDYSPPAITALSVKRCKLDENGDYVNDTRGDHVKVTFSASITPLNDKNTALYKVQFKKSTDAQYTEVSIAEQTGKYSVSNHEYVFEATPGKSYDVSVLAIDRHNTTTKSSKAPTAKAIFSWRGFRKTDGTVEDGAGIGKVPEKPNTLQVGWLAEFENSTRHIGNTYTVGSPGETGVLGYVRIAEITITGMAANSPIVFELVRRGANTPMVVSVLFVSDNTLDPKLQTIWYEGSNYDVRLKQSSASVWDLYVAKVDANDDITLSRWYTSTYMEDRVSVKFPCNLVSAVIGTWYKATPAVLRSIIDCLLPVGMIIHLYSHADPEEMYPGTRWERLENTFLWGCDENGGIGTTGGEKTHTLTENEMPSHHHGGVYSGNVTSTKSYAWFSTTPGTSMGYSSILTGGDQAHNNMPPYTQVSIWRRTA